MNIISGIYKIQSKIKSDRCYIGSAININLRWRMHINQLKTNKHHSIKLQRHFNKYGISDLEFSVLYECEKERLISIEQFFIDSHKCYFNCSPTAGSTLGSKRTPEQMVYLRGWKHTEEAKRKMSQSRKGIPMSAEAIEKTRRAHIGKHLSEETKKKISKSHMGIRPSEETKLKQSIIHKGKKLKPHSAEVRKRISDAQKGRKLTEEHKAKLSAAKVGYIPWNKGLKTGHNPWNKGKVGVQKNWKKGMKLIDGKYITVYAN